MDGVSKTKKALGALGGVIAINLLLVILIPSTILTISMDMIGAFCLLGSIAAILTALHPLFVIFAGVFILQARSEKRSNDISAILAAVLLFLSMGIIPFTMGYGILLSPLMVFAAMGIYLHSLLETKHRLLLYTGMGLLLLFYLSIFIIFWMSDTFGGPANQAAVLTASILPLSTCTLYLISLYHSFHGLAAPGRDSPTVGEQPGQTMYREPSILMPPPGWMADGQPLSKYRRGGAPPHIPPGWEIS